MADTILTRQGYELVALALTGQELRFTKVLFGDSEVNGVIVEPTLQEQVDYEELVHAREMELPIVECRNMGDGTVAVTFLIDNATLLAGFYAREIGFYAKVGSKERLYAYVNYGLASSWIPASSEERWRVYVTLTISIEQTQNVTAQISEGLALTSRADFLDHINSEEPHPNIPQVKQALTNALNVWATDEDNHLHKMSVNNLASQILGDVSTLAQMNARLNQTEQNIANLYTQLGAADMQANLLVLEDFKTLAEVDMYKVRVLVTVEGVFDLELETDSGIRAGAYYTLSDGLKSETVQIKAMAKNDNKYVATLYETVKNTYELDNCYLYRSSINVSEAVAHGGGDLRTLTINFGEQWQGVASNQTEEMTLPTRQSNAARFELEGDAAFTATGFFTLG